MRKIWEPLAGILASAVLAAGLLLAGVIGVSTLWGADLPHVRWGYRGDIGPAYWGSLDPAFAACARGSEQSPIDISNAQSRTQPPIEFDYGPRAAEIVNTGHTIQVNVTPGSGIIVDDIGYELLQFHFHRGSEHTVAGVRFPLELRLVHRSEDGALAVIGVLFRAGAVNEALAPVWDLLPPDPGTAVALPDPVDVAALLPGRLTTWRYAGSLTTPPCTEGVAKAVITEPMTLSPAQIEAFAAIYDGNYRPVQALNDRLLVRDDPSIPQRQRATP